MRTFVRVLCFTGMLLLTAFSTGATAVGFSDYGLPRDYAMASAAVVEIVLLAGLFVFLDRQGRGWMRATGLGLYLLFAGISVYGSFVAINALLVVQDRRQENSEAICREFR